MLRRAGLDHRPRPEAGNADPARLRRRRQLLLRPDASAAAAATPREASRPSHVLARNDYTIMVVVLGVAASIAAAVARRTRPTNTRPP
jgi:hypothetical protein